MKYVDVNVDMIDFLCREEGTDTEMDIAVEDFLFM